MILWDSNTAEHARPLNPDPLGVTSAALLRAAACGFACTALVVGVQADAALGSDASFLPVWVLALVAGLLLLGAVLLWRVADGAEFLPEPLDQDGPDAIEEWDARLRAALQLCLAYAIAAVLSPIWIPVNVWYWIVRRLGR